MQPARFASRHCHGSTLLASTVLSSVIAVTAAGLLSLSSYSRQSEHGRSEWTQAYYHAENAVQWAAQKIGDEASTNLTFLGQYSMGGGNLPLLYLETAAATTRLKNVWVDIAGHPSGVANLFQVQASAKVGDKVRTLVAAVRKNPPSVIFDYEYFLNNWGWWWGSTITGNGDNRANWDFDFRYNPTVNGSVLANGAIESNGNPVDPFTTAAPFGGTAATDLFAYVHSGVPRVQMPNLKNFDKYKATALARGGKLYLGGTLVVDGVRDDAAKPGLYLVGTDTNPIRIDGPVVIDGDVVIKGKMTGIGTLYVGGNLYVTGNLIYTNGPSFTTPPETLSVSARDTWVQNAVNDRKDLIAFAVRESIFGGAPNTSHWKYWEYDASGWGLAHIGGESSLGRDGIRHTPDDGIPYLDTNGDGMADSAWFDADEDGVVDLNYNYDTQIKMTTARADKINGYPASSGSPVDFNSISSNAIGQVDGIFYCNHAVAFRMATSSSVWNGTIISHDEAIVYNTSLKINYDSRVHSRYSTDPNRYIDFGLPMAYLAQIQHIQEIAPVEGFAY